MSLPEPLPDLLKRLRDAAGMSQADLAAELSAITGTATLTRSDISRWERGRRRPTLWLAALAMALDVPVEMLEAAPPHRPDATAGQLDEAEVLDLLDRIEASDISAATLSGLELVTADLCRRYPALPPAELLPPVQTYREHVARLLDGRATLKQRTDLMVIAGWLSLLAACLHEDLGQRARADLATETAARLGDHTGHSDLDSWSCEIKAWQGLLDGDYDEAVSWSRAGLQTTGKTTSAAAQLTAQQARAYARLGEGRKTRQMLADTAIIVNRLPKPEEPGSHFTFDPSKLTSYTATTLAWLKDGSADAEQAARTVISGERHRPRRVATARLDLALTLACRGDLEEAAHEGTLAIESRRLVPSNWWRAAEVDDIFASAHGGPTAAAEFHQELIAARRSTL